VTIVTSRNGGEDEIVAERRSWGEGRGLWETRFMPGGKGAKTGKPRKEDGLKYPGG